uniref:Uncharacterized protein n=1 Tax=Anguilla anguilla TaxID=7936 RepID=A0A0E9R3J9_ANGAN
MKFPLFKEHSSSICQRIWDLSVAPSIIVNSKLITATGQVSCSQEIFGEKKGKQPVDLHRLLLELRGNTVYLASQRGS